MILMLTKVDLDQIRKLVQEEVGEKISHLPTKDDFFQAMDKLMKELQNHGQERAAMKFRFDDHEERITTLEKFHSADLSSG